MNISGFFIHRPIFASVLSILIFIAGLISIPSLPISEYPEVSPPSVAVSAVFPGADATTVSETVATPLEERINGVENMLYMKSVAGSDGVLVLTVTFRPGTDPDDAQVKVQNRVAQAEPRLPEAVRQQGVVTVKQSHNETLVVQLRSPGDRYDALYLRNYAVLHVRDELARIQGVGDAKIYGSGDYAMRLWLDPDKIAALGMTAGDVVEAVREQNVQVSAGQLGAPPNPSGSDFLLSINAQGRLVTEEEFGDVIVKTGSQGQVTRLRDVARVEMDASSYSLMSLLNNKPAVAISVLEAPGANAIEISDQVRAKMDELAKHYAGQFEHLLYGAIADDVGDYRPGMKAASDRGIEAPLIDAGFTKDDVRAVSRAWDLPTWDDPASACLSSRIPYGTAVTTEALSMIDRAERALKAAGFRQVRVRHHSDVARIELPPEDLVRVISEGLNQSISESLKEIGYKYVTLDLEGYRTGSLNEVLVGIQGAD